MRMAGPRNGRRRVTPDDRRDANQQAGRLWPRARSSRARWLRAAGWAAALAVACPVTGGPSAARAATYYVSPTGTNATGGAAGSAAAPWQTLQFAADRVAAGDTVVATPGNYAGFRLTTSGTSANRITFQAQPGATINARNTFTADGINLENASYVTIDGFTLSGSGNPSTTRAGIRVVGSGAAGDPFSHGVVVQNNTANNWGVWGIFSGFAEGLTVRNNVASNSAQQHGIYVSNSADNPVIRNNVVFGNAASGIHMNGDINTGDTSVPGVDGVIRNAVVEGNVIRGNGGGSAFTAGGGSAINADGVQASAFRNNLLYDNHASGISLFRIDGGGGSSGNAVVNNTIVNAADSRWPLNITNGSTGNTVFNNVLYDLNTSGARGAMTVSADSLSGLVSNRNFLDPRIGIDESPISLAQWRSQTGQDLNSTSLTLAQLQALFANYAGNDFTLAANSAAINAGVSGLLNGTTAVPAPSTDLLGTARPQGGFFDVGAYEAAAAGVPEPGGTSVVAAAAVLAAVAARGRRSLRRRSRPD